MSLLPPVKPFVGRKRELAVLTDALQRAHEGATATVLVSGDPGIGKTSLVSELARRAEDTGALTLWGRAWEGGKAPAFWPWMPVLRAACATAPRRLLEGAPQLLHLMPELRDPAWSTAPAAVTDELGRFELFRQVADLLRHAASAIPCVVVLDDIHAADEASLTLLRFAVQALSGERVLFVGIYRAGDPRTSGNVEQITHLAREAELVTMEGLSEQDVRALLDDRLGGAATDGLAAELHRATAGNPFFVDEVARAIASARPGDDEPLPIPEVVRLAVRRDLAVLPPACTEALQVASVLGGRFDVRTLAEVLALDGARLLEVIGPALSNHIVETADEPSTFAFRHSLLRESLYEDVPPADRMRMHLRVAETLEKLHGVDPDPHLSHIAHHFLAALPLTDPHKVIRYVVGAAEWATSVAAWHEAASYYERALGVAEAAADERAALPIMCELALARARSGDPRWSNESALRTMQLAAKLDEPLLLVRAAAIYNHPLPYGVADIEAIRVLRSAATAIGPEHRVERANIVARLAVQLAWGGDTEGAARAASQASALVEQAPDGVTKQRALSYIHRALWGPDSLERRLREGPRITQLASEASGVGECAEAHAGLMVSLLEAGDGAAADRRLEETERLAELSREPRHIWHASILRATRETMAARFEAAERLAGIALEAGRGAHEPDAFSIYAAQIAAIRREQGRLDELVPFLADGTSENPAWRFFVAYVHAQTGNHLEARVTLDALAADGFATLRRDETWLAALAVAAEVAVVLGDRAAVRHLYGLLQPYAGRAVVVSLGIACLGTVSRVLGLLAGLVEGADPRRHFEAALVEAARLGSPNWLAHARLDFASFLAASPDPADRPAAEGLARAAESTYEALGMSAYRERAARLTATPAPPAADPSPPGVSATLRREGSYWDVAFGDASFRVRDIAGLTYLAGLLAVPGREIHVADLMSARFGSAGGSRTREPDLTTGLRDAGDVLDPEARAQYRRRLDELREDLEDAREFQDADRAGAVQEEIDALSKALAQAVGLGGRSRKASSDAERARLNVTRALRTAMRRLEELCPALGIYLTKGIRTGTFCSYEPDPRFPVRWTL